MKKIFFMLVIPMIMFAAESLPLANGAPDLLLQVLSFEKGKLQFRLGSNYAPFYDKSGTVIVESEKEKPFIMELREGGESGMGLTQEKVITITKTVELSAVTIGKVKFKFILDPVKLAKLARNYDWMTGIVIK
jgi:hypothetical protein